MTRDQAIAIILARCGKRQNDTFLQAQCVLEMTLKQETTLEGADFKPWFLLSEYMHALTGENEPRVPLPTNFLEELEEGILWVQAPGATAYTRLIRDDLDILEERYLDCDPGVPQAYALAGKDAVLFPTPADAYPLKMRCYLREPKLEYAYGAAAASDDTTNEWLTQAPDWLIGEVGAVIAGQYIKDAPTAEQFAMEAAKGRARLYVAHVAREEMNRQRSMGDD